MSSPTTTTDLLDPLHGQLCRLRTRLKQWVIVDGVFSILACLMALAMMDLVFDWLFVMDRPQRIVMLAMSICLLGFVAARRLLIPLVNMPTDDALCLQLEHGNRHLGEALISSLQFSRDGGQQTQGVSTSMMQAAIQQGLRSAGPLEVDSVLDLQRYRRNWMGLMFVGLISAAAVLIVITTQFGSIWFQRNVLLQNQDWPQEVYLEFVGIGPDGLRVPQGINWPLAVVVTDQSRREPEAVVLEVKQSAMIRTEPMQAAAGNQRFTTSLQSVNQPLQVRAVAERDSTPWVEIKPVPYPLVAEMQIETILPPYAGAPRRLLEPGETMGTIVEGSQICVRGKATKPLSLARLVVQGGRTSRHKTVMATLSEDQQFEALLQVSMADSGQVVLELVDQDRVAMPGSGKLEPLTNSDAARLMLRVRPDQAPQVRLQRGEIGLMVVPQARIPFTMVINEEYGLTDVQLRKEWRIRGAGRDSERQRSSIRLGDIPGQFGKDNQSFKRELDLQEHEVLPVGAELVMYIEATDNNNLTGPRTGQSAALRFRVVSTEQLRKMLLQEESSLRKNLGQLQTKQIENLADTRVLFRRVEQGKRPGRAEIAVLAQLQKQQKQIGASLSLLVKNIQGIRSELFYNRLDSDSIGHHQRLTSKVIEPLEILITKDGPEAVLHLDRARRTIEDLGTYRLAVQDASNKQAEIGQRLKSIENN
ncbi:MAG: hypothetical protein N2C12_15715, partial [Planctomycetales bacterium]